MTIHDLNQRLEFLRKAERLKDTPRSAYTTEGKVESVAEHSWRLSLLVLTFADQLEGIDLLRLLKICILHDLGEAINGDIPAPSQAGTPSKSADERKDFLSLIHTLPAQLREEFLSMWDDYENGISIEAQTAKAMDKLETIMQHNQGQNPVDFDYRFNLGYGKPQTDKVPLAVQIRELLDHDTETLARKNSPA